jgi:hypothetical protein
MERSDLSRRELLVQTLLPPLLAPKAMAQPHKSGPGDSIIVQAGRRVDAPNAETPRFPATNVVLVRTRIQAYFSRSKPLALVTAAACGSDLLALEIATEMDVERFILLPSTPEVFRTSSVTDRPGDWGVLFDRMIKESHVTVLTVPEGQQGYLETNVKLLDTGEALAKQHRAEALALVVWDRKSRGPDDVTGHFLVQARLRQLPVIEISTL